MEHLVFSTAVVAAREQFGFWRDSFRGAVFGLASEPLSSTDRGFRAQAEAWIAPSLEQFRCSAESLRVFRSPKEIARQLRDSIWIYQELGSPTCFEQNGHEFVAAAGDIIITDANQPFGICAPHDYCHDIWMLPKSLVMPHLPALRRSLWVPLKAGAGIAGVLGAYLQALTQEMHALSPGQLEAVAHNLAQLVAVVCGAPQAEYRQAVQAALLDRAKQHIARHLADPDLTPANTAAALGVSLRTLHRALEPSGESFAQFVIRQRLAKCQAALTGLATGDRSVADIAFGWGFQSLATFNRAFRREYGISPNEMRQATLHATR